MSRVAALLVTGCALLLAGCSRQNAALESSAPAEPGPTTAMTANPPPIDILGVWLPDGPDDALQVVGDKPALTPAGRKLYEAHRRAAARGDHGWDGTLRCLPPGTPRIMTIAQPFDIAVDAHLIALTFQYQRLTRLIYMDDTYPATAEPTFMGESHGRWEGKALVVETKNFKAGLVLDGTGLPQSDRLGITERIERIDDDTLADLITIVDEQMYQRPWQAQITLKRRPALQIEEDVCVERAGIHP